MPLTAKEERASRNGCRWFCSDNGDRLTDLVPQRLQTVNQPGDKPGCTALNPPA